MHGFYMFDLLLCITYFVVVLCVFYLCFLFTLLCSVFSVIHLQVVLLISFVHHIHSSLT